MRKDWDCRVMYDLFSLGEKRLRKEWIMRLKYKTWCDVKLKMHRHRQRVTY